jgi:transposase
MPSAATKKFNGLRQASFPVFLKQTEFRFNARENDLYKILLKSRRLHPLRR